MSELKINDIILFSDKRRYTKLEGKIGIVIGHDNDSAYKIVCPQVDMRPYSSTAGMNEQNAVEVLEANKFLSFIFGIK